MSDNSEDKMPTGGNALLNHLSNKMIKVDGRIDALANTMHTLGGQLGLITKIAWLMLALVLTTAATGIIKHIIGGIFS